MTEGTEKQEIERLRELLVEVYSHISSALAQSIDEDDQIIVGHLRSSVELIKDGLKR